MKMIPPRCSMERFAERFERVSRIGSTGDGGVHRPFGSTADLELRHLLQTIAQDEVGLAVHVDPIANIWGIHAGCEQLPAIALGSHHDSVPYGGRFDGPLGILVALEVIQTLKEHGFPNRHPLAFISFTAEEPNPFDLSTMGSRTVTGRLTKEQLHTSKDWDGRSLQEAIAAAGGNLARVHESHLSASDLFAFLELHIEQGRRLEQANIPLGVVNGICGIYREHVTILGEANHAGTTMMRDRHDALLAGAKVALALEALIKESHRDDLVGTVGRFAITPNAANIIPGTCDLVVEIRGATTEDMHATARSFAQATAAIEAEYGVSITREILLDQAPQPLAHDVIELLQHAAQEQSTPYSTLFSMAGHDATHIASFTRAGMLFVPSIGGKSHCKEELTDLQDVAPAIQVFIQTVMELDQR
ncbi:MAG: Zn-dependent hydrolase [Acidibacillus sp.]|uniref:Hydrolase n=1 Tax=Sulfoacidibacillus ferrooxidans TaxID=2005001 RepID=A0A9X1V7E0_9BACL|nr:Zn-dependent hydrolase [Sulfoacidibacillus ferrooxidans]MCI0182916.1 putative hydrolase [Sulfoacidibacillus ferrooxidans]MCY0893511.1 Zn-dependent hydrolase [Acidibacillus sp.]